MASRVVGSCTRPARARTRSTCPPVEISCAFPPSLGVVDHIVEAERLGYQRAWLFDSPALYPDIWVIAALAALRTERIGLGPAVLVPNLRHPLTQASAIATLEGSSRPGAPSWRSAPGSPVAWRWAGSRSRGRTPGVTSSSSAGCCAASRWRSTVRWCRCCTVPASDPAPHRDPDRRGRQRTQGPRGRARPRRRRDDDRRRRAFVRLVLGAPVRHRARPRRRCRLRTPARGRGPRAHRRVPRHVRGRSRFGRRPPRRCGVAGVARRRAGGATSSRACTKIISCA